MRVVLALLAVGSAVAFAPGSTLKTSVQRSASRVAPSMAEMSPAVPFLLKPKYYPSGMVGDVGFDPLGLAEYFDIKFLREAELKHGRVAMLATVGFIVQEFFQLPGDMYSNPNPVAAFAQVGPQPIAQIIVFGGVVEGFLNGGMTYMDMFADKDRVPGDYGFDPLKLMKEGDPDEYALKEITHGRLAMIAIGGMIHQSFITGTGLFGHSL